MLVGSRSKPVHVRFIEYTGKYPTLCMGVLILEIDGKRYHFGYDYDDEDLVWDDFTDTWYVPRGWHEDVWFMEESYQIDETEFEVVAWKEKCKPYKEKE